MTTVSKHSLQSSSFRRVRRVGVILTVTIVASLAALSSNVSADVPFCMLGSGPGQCNHPYGVAVDHLNGHVYVADNNNNRVNVFEEDGDFLTSFGSAGTGSGQFTGPTGIAVDNDPTSPSHHDVYVVDSPVVVGKSQPRVQRFNPDGTFVLSFGAGLLNSGQDPIAAGPGGTIYVGDNFKGGAEAQRSVLRFAPSGTLLGSSSLMGEALVAALVVDSGGNFYVNRIGAYEVTEKYEPTTPGATLLSSFDATINTKALAIDSADNLYAFQSGQPNFITKRDPTGSVVKRFGYGHIDFILNGLSIGASGDLFGSEPYVGSITEGNRVIRLSQPPPGPISCCVLATPGNTKASIKGQINPEGASTTYHVDYIPKDDFIANGNSFSGPNPFVSTAESAAVGSDFSLYDVETQIGCAKAEFPPQDSCLKPETIYRARLVATNADGVNTTEVEFETKAPFELTETFATDAGTDSVQLRATLNPLEVPATGYFEYIDDASYQADVDGGGDGFGAAVKAPDVDAGRSPLSFGSGNAPKTIGTLLSSLAPGTTYHYRVVVADPFTSEVGPERSVTTFPILGQPSNACPNAVFRIGPSAVLPNCRAFEMVSPVDKNGNDIKVLVSGGNFPSRLDQSSTDGDRFTYSSSTAFGDALSAPWTSQYIATRSEEGWSTHAINPPRESTSLMTNAIRFDLQYRYFSPDLSNGWVFQDANPALDDCAPEGFINFYRRDDATGEYEALVPVEPIEPNEEDYRLELQGLSADGTRAVFRANAKLTENAAKTSNFAYQIYEYVKDEGCGELRLVSALPSGKANLPSASVGSDAQPGEHREARVLRAVSADGSRIFWITFAGSLYVRVNADQEQSVVSGGSCSEPEKACTLQISSDPKATFWTAATDGSRVFYSIKDGGLYEFDVDKARAGETANTLIAGGVNRDFWGGVAGASENGSRVFFVSREQLNGEGEAGKRNLFIYDTNKSDAERYHWIATLEEPVENRYNGFIVAAQDPIQNGVRLTPDGSHLAFVSDRPLTGYDTKDASDGRPALQIYLYDVEGDKLSCISCNPSGGRPAGRLFSFGKSRRVSAQMPPGENQSFAPRALTEDGNHLFFESFEPLLPRDTNGKADAYEWQRADSQQECNAVGAELYVPGAHGCISLLSTGQSPVDTEIADATPDGSDVFIRTASSILPQDPGLVDIYDVRVGGGQPQPPGIPAACEGEACQGPLAPPNDPTPASSAFEGAGNVKESPPSCRKPKVKRKGRCVVKKKSVAKHKAKKAKRNRRAGR